MDNKFNNTLDLLWCGRVAQLAEQCPFKAWVDGSSPSALTICFSDLQMKYFWTSVQFGPSS
jgi:hypothetical protein